MKFIVTQRKTEVEQSVKDYAEKKLAKLEKYFTKDSTANITFNELRELKIIEVTVAHNGLFFRAECRDKEELAAIDKIVDVLERQIRKNKTKLEKRLRVDAFQDEMPASFAEVDFDIVRKKHFDVKPYTEEEAILQMEMLGHKFFFFQNADQNDRYSVIYSREDGGYGLIQS